MTSKLRKRRRTLFQRYWLGLQLFQRRLLWWLSGRTSGSRALLSQSVVRELCSGPPNP